jgi:hypothetical protein
LIFKHFFGLAPQVAALLEVLPNRLTADVLEQLRLNKQELVLKTSFWNHFIQPFLKIDFDLMYIFTCQG